MVSVDQAPERIGRYIVLRELGRGAHGVVYAAYDPQLDRQLAIKLLATDRARSPRAQAARERLLREARAMAQISHPNVVAVFDSGVFEGRSGPEVYLAMELVEGEDLGAHLDRLAAARPDPDARWPEVLRLFQAAGRGLAAAHAQGLVHRDFKPANVLVAADDGRVLVGDFGLVVSEGERSAELRAPADVADDADTGLTRSGELLGTPAYMSPEQHVGRATSPASDQFSFALALHEAIYGAPAFAGDTPAARTFAVTSGDLRPLPRKPRLPPKLQASLQRALTLEPADRYPSMSALLEDLELRQPGWRPALVGATIALAAALGAFGLGRWGRDAPCPDPAERLAPAWGPERRAALGAAVSELGRPWTEAALVGLTAQLDAYAVAWGEAHREACLDTEVRHTASPARLDRRWACLELRRGALDALVNELLAPTPELVERAPAAVAGLVDPASCAEAPARPAPSPAARRVELTHARARAQVGAGRLDRARAGLDEAAQDLAASRADERPELLAEQALLEGRLATEAGRFEDAEPHARRALRAALRLGDRALTARAAALLGRVVGLERGRLHEGLTLADVAGSARAAATLDAPEPAAVAQLRAALLAGLGERAAAVATATAALARLDDAPLARGRSRVVLGEILVDARAFAAAEPVLEGAIEDLSLILGDGHPSLVRPLTLLSRARFGRGDLETAEALVERALELATEVHGEEHPLRAQVLLRLGPVLSRTGRIEASVERYLEALDILRRAYGDLHTLVARAHVNLGASYHRLGELELAEASYRAAIRIREARLGSSHPDLVVPLQNLGSLLVDRGQPSAAIPVFERTWRIRQSTFAPPAAVADVSFWLGRALYESRSDPQRGLRMMGEALAVMEREGAPSQRYVTEYLEGRRLLAEARAAAR